MLVVSISHLIDLVVEASQDFVGHLHAIMHVWYKSIEPLTACAWTLLVDHDKIVVAHLQDGLEL